LVHDTRRVLVCSDTEELQPYLETDQAPPSFEMAGPRAQIFFTPQVVEDIHEHGGTLLGSSRGPQDVGDMVETLMRYQVGILFAVGGDGTLRGVTALCQEMARRGQPISVIAIPKTIDNDLAWIERSFGFATAVEEARQAIRAAHAEARGAWNGIGLVKLMGRHAGFIAAHASLANADVNFCLVPEVPFTLGGKGGLFNVWSRNTTR
jgi:6-phosphofructokinase 1